MALSRYPRIDLDSPARPVLPALPAKPASSRVTVPAYLGPRPYQLDFLARARRRRFAFAHGFRPRVALRALAPDVPVVVPVPRYSFRHSAVGLVVSVFPIPLARFGFSDVWCRLADPAPVAPAAVAEPSVSRFAFSYPVSTPSDLGVSVSDPVGLCRWSFLAPRPGSSLADPSLPLDQQPIRPASLDAAPRWAFTLQALSVASLSSSASFPQPPRYSFVAASPSSAHSTAAVSSVDPPASEVDARLSPDTGVPVPTRASYDPKVEDHSLPVPTPASSRWSFVAGQRPASVPASQPPPAGVPRRTPAPRPPAQPPGSLEMVYGGPRLARPEAPQTDQAWDAENHPGEPAVPVVQEPRPRPVVAVGESDGLSELRDGISHGVGAAIPGAPVNLADERDLLKALEESGVDVRKYSKQLDAQLAGERRHSTALELQLTFHSAVEHWRRTTRLMAAESRSVIEEVRQTADVTLKQSLYLRMFVDLLRSQADGFGSSIDRIRVHMERTIDAELDKTFQHAKKLDKLLEDADERLNNRIADVVDVAEKRVHTIFEQAQASAREAQQALSQISQGATTTLQTLQRVEQSVHAYEERSSHIERDMKQADRLYSGMAERFQAPVGIAAGFAALLGAGIGAFLAVLLYMFLSRVG